MGLSSNPAGLLKIGELGDLHPVEPDLPAQTPCAQGGGFPVVLHKPDIVIEGIDPEGLQAVEIDLLDIQGGRFHDDLVLIIVLKPIGILSVSAIRGTPGRLDIGHIPGLGAQGPEKGGRVKSSGTHLRIIGLLNHTPLIRPEPLECKRSILENSFAPPSRQGFEVSRIPDVPENL